ncbi:hypothetical protein A3F66_03730 [candidate division TM6 bacterium RIFCSPHIGHO2_12_FULL_32_22]|nr:MAG: hypothetical protein A3F66_03730 [candidate division TM6 bacterium RIFCSPHIGHO2_12_FULL_32_22]
MKFVKYILVIATVNLAANNLCDKTNQLNKTEQKDLTKSVNDAIKDLKKSKNLDKTIEKYRKLAAEQGVDSSYVFIVKQLSDTTYTILADGDKEVVDIIFPTKNYPEFSADLKTIVDYALAPEHKNGGFVSYKTPYKRLSLCKTSFVKAVKVNSENYIVGAGKQSIKQLDTIESLS